MQNLYLDLDDVILETSKFKAKLHNLFSNDEVKIYKQSTNEMKELLVYSQLLSRYSEVPVNKQYLDVLGDLKSKYTIYYVSMYTSDSEYDFKRSLSISHGVLFKGVNSSKHEDKSSIDMSKEGSIFVDDNINYLRTSNCPNKIFYGKISTYLLAGGISAGFSCVNNWEKLSSILLEKE